MSDSLAVPSTTTVPPKRLMIIEDHELLRTGLRNALVGVEDLEVCGEAADADEAFRLIAELHPDLAIVDLALNRGDGIRLIERLRDEAPDLRCLVLSGRDANLHAEQALRAGAAGYVEKGEPIEEILRAVRTVLDGEVYLSEELTRQVLRRFPSPGEASPVDKLSDREREVLRLIGEGAPTRRIAQELQISASTVETYRDRLKTKLQLQNAAELTRRALQWVMETE